jgi:hypothetical protein
MDDFTTLRIYFICRGCTKVYVAAQTHKPAPGRYNCEDCGKTVHDWAGYYSFTDWKPA